MTQISPECLAAASCTGNLLSVVCDNNQGVVNNPCPSNRGNPASGFRATSSLLVSDFVGARDRDRARSSLPEHARLFAKFDGGRPMTKGYSLVLFAVLLVATACGAADNGENPRSIAGNKYVNTSIGTTLAFPRVCKSKTDYKFGN